MPTDGNILTSSNRTRSVSPTPFVVSHDTFINNCWESLPTDPVIWQKKKEIGDEEATQKEITNMEKTSICQPVFIVEPPTPTIVKNRGLLNETKIKSDFHGKEDASEIMFDRNAESSS